MFSKKQENSSTRKCHQMCIHRYSSRSDLVIYINNVEY